MILWHFEESHTRAKGHGVGPALVLLPGWATDGRIFDRLDLGRDVVMPQGPLTGGLGGLADVIARLEVGPVVLCGWSMGGFAAADFARGHPELVVRLVLAGIRQRYPAGQIDSMRRALARDRAGCLAGFYRQCFLPAQRGDYQWFRAALEPVYLAELAEADLEAGLDYLAEAVLTPETLPACPTTIIHGARDAVAPLEEVLRLGWAANIPVHVVPGAAHAVFLAEAFLPHLEHACSRDR